MYNYVKLVSNKQPVKLLKADLYLAVPDLTHLFGHSNIQPGTFIHTYSAPIFDKTV
jgi:hypothetical protein